MPCQPSQTQNLYGVSPRTYYSLIRVEPDQVHPALRPKAPDHQESADREAKLREATRGSAARRVIRRVPPFYNGPATKIPDLYPAGYFENPRPAPKPPRRDSFSEVVLQACNPQVSAPAANPRQKKSTGYYRNKPLPPPPQEAISVPSLRPQPEPARRRDGPGEPAAAVIKRKPVPSTVERKPVPMIIKRKPVPRIVEPSQRPVSVRVQDNEYDPGTGKRPIGKSRFVEEMDHQPKRFLSFSKKCRDYARSTLEERRHGGTRVKNET